MFKRRNAHQREVDVVKPRLSLFLMITAIVALLWILFPVIVASIAEFGGSSIFTAIGQAGMAGDSFGVLNSLFTGLALAALVYAILVQVEQLKQQAANLELYRKEVEETLIHLEREDAWNRLKLRMDVLPHLTRRAEDRFRSILFAAPTFMTSSGEVVSLDRLVVVSEGFASNAAAIELVSGKIDSLIAKVEGSIKEDLETAKNCYSHNGVISVDAVEVLPSLHDARAVLDELRKYHSDLESAYKEAAHPEADEEERDRGKPRQV